MIGFFFVSFHKKGFYDMSRLSLASIRSSALLLHITHWSQDGHRTDVKTILGMNCFSSASEHPLTTQARHTLINLRGETAHVQV
jgi:hypothetical protein